MTETPSTEQQKLAREILNRHTEYTDGLTRGQVMIRTSNALAAVEEALNTRSTTPPSAGEYQELVEELTCANTTWAIVPGLAALMRKAADAIRTLIAREERQARALDEIMTEYRTYGAAAIDVMFQIAKDARGSEPHERAALNPKESDNG